MKKYSHIIETMAKGCDFDSNLIKAIIEVESNWNEHAYRYEPEFHEKYIKNSKYPKEDHVLLASSLGLMQVMGVVAREHGFIGNLKDLFIPEVNILYGCLHLKKFQDKYKYKYDIITSYNAGSPRKNSDGTYMNQQYVDKINKALEKYM